MQKSTSWSRRSSSSPNTAANSSLCTGGLVAAAVVALCVACVLFLFDLVVFVTRKVFFHSISIAWTRTPLIFYRLSFARNEHAFRYNHKTGEWAHTSRLTRFPERKWLSALDLLDPTSIPTLPAALGPAHSLSLSTPRAEEQPLEVEGVPRDKGTDDEAAVAAAMGSSLPLDLVLNAWGVRSLSQLLQRILAAADDLLAEMEMANDTKAKKSGGKGRGTGKGASKEAAVGPGAEAGMGGELSLFEDVRWFALASDGDPDPPFSHSSSPGGLRRAQHTCAWAFHTSALRPIPLFLYFHCAPSPDLIPFIPFIPFIPLSPLVPPCS